MSGREPRNEWRGGGDYNGGMNDQRNYSYQTQQHDERRGGPPPANGYPRHRGVDLQQYTGNHHSHNGWETVSSRNNNLSRPSHALHNEQPPPRNNHNNTDEDASPFMLLLVGIPGSGKSTFAKALIEQASSRYVRINQDTLKTRKKCEAATRRALSQNKCPVIDRCNFDANQRRHFVDIGREFHVPVYCISLELPKDVCLERCMARKYHETIRPGEERGVVAKMYHSFQAPHVREGFEHVERACDTRQIDQLLQEYSNY